MSRIERHIAVVIGINAYGQGVPFLTTPVNDAKVLADLLKREHGYEQVWLLLDELATAKKLGSLLKETLPQAVRADNHLLFYFAGHGIAINGEEGPEGYLIPQDARLNDTQTYLSMSAVEQALTNLSCKHCLVILDCCFAGSFRWAGGRDIATVPEVIHKERFDRFVTDPAWQVITSSGYDQTAQDVLRLSTDRTLGQTARGEHSPFAAALIDALSGQADIYPPARNNKPAGDGIITATELYLYLRDRVEIPAEQQNKRQTPGLWYLKRHDKGEYIFLTQNFDRETLANAPTLDEQEVHNPYRGLKSFEKEHAALFFGRKGLIEQLCDVVSDRPFTVVLGASGSGKSSLIKAGLIPHLDSALQPKQVPHQKLKRSEESHACKHRAWKILTPIRPGQSPLQNLSSALQSLGEDNRLASSAIDGFKEAIAAWSQAHPNTKLLLVIDQLEELITLCSNEQERQQFLTLLTDLLQANPSVLHLVVTVRSDFEPQFRSTSLEALWQAGRFVVPAMTREELRAVIEEPAFTKVVYFQTLEHRGNLVDQLMEEVAGMPGALPLLSFALSELYLKLVRRYLMVQHRGDLVERVITWADYDDLGGVTKSLTRRADEEYAALVTMDSGCAQTIRHVMLRMVTVGGELARRQVPESELKYPEPENRRVQAVIQRFLAARLLVSGTDVNQQPYIEPAHDALVRGWKKLLVWKQQEEGQLILQRRLTPAAVEWERAKHRTQERSAGFLTKADGALDWIDRRLVAIEQLVNQIPTRLARLFQRSQHPQDSARQKPTQFLWDRSPYLETLVQTLHTDDNGLNQVERDFVRESSLQKRRNTSWRWRIAIAVMLGLSSLAIAALIGQRSSQINQIRASRQSAESNLRAGQQLDAFLSVLGAAHGLKQPLLLLFKPESVLEEQVRGTLQKTIYSVQERNRLSEHEGTARSSLSPDGQLIVSADEEGKVILWNWQGQKQRQWDTQQGNIMNLSFSPNGQQVVTAGSDATVRFWNLQGQPLTVLRGHTDIVKGLTFSPDGQLLATSGSDRTIRLWTIQGQPLAVLRGHQDDVWSVAFSPNGQLLASASGDDTFRLWTLQGKLLKQFKANQGELYSIKFSPDGQRLATTGKDGRIRLWNLQGKQLAVFQGHEGRVWNVVFSADGQQLASAAADGTVRLWNVNGSLLSVFSRHQGPVRNVSISPDGLHLVSSGDDSTVRLWDVQGQENITLKGHQGSVRAITFSSDGQRLVTGGDDATIRLWQVQGSLRASIKNEQDLVRAIALSPDGQRLASAQGKTIRLWTAAGQLLREFPMQQGLVRSLHFSPDGQQLVSAGEDGRIYLWNFQGGSLAQWQADPSRVWAVKFSPDGQRLASAGQNGIVHLWSLQGKSLTKLEGHLGPVYSVDFSPDGQQLASAGQDGTIRLWNLADNRKVKLFQVSVDRKLPQKRGRVRVRT
jgi:WD40 repeat protein